MYTETRKKDLICDFLEGCDEVNPEREEFTDDEMSIIDSIIDGAIEGTDDIEKLEVAIYGGISVSIENIVTNEILLSYDIVDDEYTLLEEI